MDRLEMVDQRAVEVEEKCVERVHIRAQEPPLSLEAPGCTFKMARQKGLEHGPRRGDIGAMPVLQNPTDARATVRADGDLVELRVGGVWRLSEALPQWKDLAPAKVSGRLRVVPDGLGYWDMSLLLFLDQAARWSVVERAEWDGSALPERLRALLVQIEATREAATPVDRCENLLVTVGLATRKAVREMRFILQFVGECALATRRSVLNPGHFRWKDCLAEMQACGAMALPVVSLVSFLVGLTLAYSGAIVLRRYGGDIYVADILGVAMTREMGAVMAAVVLAGRTGAAFAAQLGSMKVNEEIDALSTLGISPVRFLVLPRLLALSIMMPLLALYSNSMGVLGGMVVAKTVLSIQPTAYWVEMLTIVDLPDLAVGLIKAVAFGLIVGLSGCLRGLQAERSAAGVGHATTSAVVTAIILIITADALFAVLFNAFGL